MGTQHKNFYKNFSKFFLVSLIMIFAVAGIAGFNAVAAQDQQGSSEDTAETYTVCAQDCDFSNIQNAVDKALSGDTIKIKGGAYNEEIRVKKNVVLQAYNDKEELHGGIYFSSPSLTVPKQTTVYLSKVVPTQKDQFPEASKKQNTKKVSDASEKKEEQEQKLSQKKDSTISTPLFDVNVHPKTQDKSDRDIIITLVIFLVIVLTILGYFVFGYIVHRNKKKDKKKDSSSGKNKNPKKQ